jgi:septum site-determining protein MinD
MSKIISIHSFRRGTGKSILSANLAVLLAMAGYRVGLVDIDMASPSVQLLFGLAASNMAHTINDYLLGHCDINHTAHDVTRRLGVQGEGRLFLVPSSLNPGQIARVLRQDYGVELLNDAFQGLIAGLHLDVLMIDTAAGLTDDTLLTLAISFSLAVIMRPDKRDYQGTGVTLDVARQLGVPRLSLVVNQVPPAFSPATIETQVARSFNCEVAAILPHSTRLMALASAGIFVLRYPDDRLTTLLWDLMARLAGLETDPFAGG